jgi:hypothetical protein
LSLPGRVSSATMPDDARPYWTSNPLDRLGGDQRAEPDVVEQHRDLEAVDQDLGVLRRRAADHHARVAERNLQIHDAGHRGQRAHDVVAGARDALQLLAIERCGAGRRGRRLAADLDRLGVAARLEHHDVVELAGGDVGERGVVARALGDQARADRRRQLELAVALGPRGLARSLDANGGTGDRLAERVDHPAGDGDDRRVLRG